MFCTYRIKSMAFGVRAKRFRGKWKFMSQFHTPKRLLIRFSNQQNKHKTNNFRALRKRPSLFSPFNRKLHQTGGGWFACGMLRRDSFFVNINTVNRRGFPSCFIGKIITVLFSKMPRLGFAVVIPPKFEIEKKIYDL